MAQVLSQLPSQPVNADVLVGYENSDDAGVFRLRDDVALVQSVDFFTPIADDPETYGAIAAINAINDIYAMGGTPLTALAIACFPRKEDLNVLAGILKGGQRAMNEEGVTVLGGHTIDDAEIKFGYSVTGIINPQKVITNAGAKPGNRLVLTKPIGTGIVSTGIKRGVTSTEVAETAVLTMLKSARLAARLMQDLGASACTDVTGFGLMGHAYEVAKASHVTLIIEASKVPLLPGTLDLAAKGMLTQGDKNNRIYVGETAQFEPNVSKEILCALYDPQTAGGLLISLDRDNARRFTDEIESSIIGDVQAEGDHLIKVI